MMMPLLSRAEIAVSLVWFVSRPSSWLTWLAEWLMKKTSLRGDGCTFGPAAR